MNIRTNTKCVLFLMMLLVSTVRATPPSNDAYINAHLLTASSGSIFGQTAEATREAGEPFHALNRGGRSVWYKYVAPGNGVLTINTVESSYDTLLAVYTGTAFSNLKEVASMDNVTVESQNAFISIATQLNTTYYIAVDGYNNEGAGAASGSYKLSWTFANASVIDGFSTPGSLLSHSRGNRVESNVGASKQVGEPDHAGNAGGKSIWFHWTAPNDMSRSYTFSTKGSVRPTGNGPLYTLLAIYTGSTVSTLTPVASSANYGAKVTFIPSPGTTYRIAVDGYDFGQGADTGTINLTWRATDSTKDLDFDLDGRGDLTVFRPTNGVWYTLDSISHSLRAVQWGTNGDKPVPGDFEGDGRLDYNIFRPDTATWWTLGSTTGATQFRWGIDTDIPFNFRSANFDYVGVFRPSNGNWYIYVGAGYSVNFGLNGDIPVPADYDGDGNDNIVIFRPSTGTWWFLNQLTGEQTPVQFGVNGDKPVPADYDGDGRTDLAVYRPFSGTWYVRRSSDGSVLIRNWGIGSDKPQPVDYDGDTLADFAVFRPSNGTWYVLRSVDGTARFIKFGQSGDKPITSISSID